MNNNDLTDAEIIVQSLTELDAFSQVFERHFVPVRAYLVRRLGEGVGNDLAAEVFCLAIAQRQRYDETRPNALPWLYGIANKLVARHYRLERRQLRFIARLAHGALDADSSEDIEARLDAQRLGPALATALLELPRRDRDALLLYAWADLSYEEVANALSIPIGTVRSRLNRARRRLRSSLESTVATSCYPWIEKLGG